MLLLVIVLFSLFYLFHINRLIYAFCLKREIPEEKQPKIFRTINTLVTILLVSLYLQVTLTV